MRIVLHLCDWGIHPGHMAASWPQGVSRQHPSSSVGENSNRNKRREEEEEDQEVFHGAGEEGRCFAQFEETPLVDGDLNAVQDHTKDRQKWHEWGTEVDDKLTVEEVQVANRNIEFNAPGITFARRFLASTASPEFPSKVRVGNSNKIGKEEISQKQGDELITEVINSTSWDALFISRWR